MNINNHFIIAVGDLKRAKVNVNTQDYDSALVSLVQAYEHVHELMNQVFSLKALKSEVESPACEDTS